MTRSTPAAALSFPFGVRASRYLAARRALGDPSTSGVAFPQDDMYAFWVWYVRALRSDRLVQVQPAPEPMDDFPEPNGGICLWYSERPEAVYTLQTIAHLRPTLLCFEDYADSLEPFSSESRPSNFVLACVAAGLAYSVTYLGVTRNDLPIAIAGATPASIEDSADFIRAWNQFHPRHRLRSCCAHLYKEEIIRELLTAGVPFSNCDTRTSAWCGDCFGCFEAYYCAKAVGFDPGFRLTSRIYDQIYNQAYLDYLKSEFKNDSMNVLHNFVRLQMIYKLAFDPSVDCI